jgi:hypothetical protein
MTDFPEEVIMKAAVESITEKGMIVVKVMVDMAYRNNDR